MLQQIAVLRRNIYLGWVQKPVKRLDYEPAARSFLVYHEILPEKCAGIATFPIEGTVTETLLIGGDGKVWQYAISTLPKISRYFNHGKHGKHGKKSTTYQIQYLRKLVTKYLK